MRRMVNAMKPGETIVYHRGFLPADRAKDFDDDLNAAIMLTFGTPEGFMVTLESTMRGEGLGYLTQRKVGPRDYIYRFTRAGRPHT